MKIVVYFETKDFKYAEVVAQFCNEVMYVACLPQLERIANERDMCVTESVREEECVNDYFDDEVIE